MSKERKRNSSSISSFEKLKIFSNRMRDDAKHSDLVVDACKCFELSDPDLREIMKLINENFEEGLRPETAAKAVIKMLPSYVRSVPNGSEKGEFLALDLGGTNFRVLLITLGENRHSEMISRIFRIPDSIMKGTGEALFDHIAACLAKFMEEHGLKNREKLPLGFTFSFPCFQEGLTRAKLINWTKGFKASGVEGRDVVQLLRDACRRRGDIDIDVVAILNDTTGTMMACAFQENTCNIGVIVGTGSNACYMEKIENIRKLEKTEADDSHTELEMCVNTEWGAFGDDGKLDKYRTEYDRALDEKSINPGKQLFEKMISGMYLGEIVRRVLEHLARRGQIFNGSYDLISQSGCFPTKYLSDIEREVEEEDDMQYAQTEQMLQDIGLFNVSTADCANVAYVCTMVSKRAAYLCACGIAALLKRMHKEYVTVGIDGSVYRFHPTFKDLLDKKIDDLVDGKIEYQIMLSEDGSGRGAALVAAVATRMAKERAEAKKVKVKLSDQQNEQFIKANKTKQSEHKDNLAKTTEHLDKSIKNE